MICSSLGKGFPTHKTFKKWFQRFRNADFDLFNRERSGQPKNIEDAELEQLLKENRTQTDSEFTVNLHLHSPFTDIENAP